MDGSTSKRTDSYWALFASEPLFLSFTIAMTFFSGFGQTFFVSVFKQPWQDAFDLSHGEFGLCYFIATTVSGFVIVWVGRFIDSIDLRPWTTFVVIGLALACGFFSMVGSVLTLVLALFALRFTGQGLMGHTAFTSAGRYFVARRGKAMSLTSLGFALGFAVFPKFGVALLDQLTWQQSWLVAAGVVGVVVLPLALGLLRGHSERHARYLERQAQPPSTTDAEPSHQRQWTRAEVVRDVRFWVILPLTLACPFLMTGFIMLHEQLVSEKGWTKDLHADAMIVLGVAQWVTSIGMGPVVDRVGALRLVGWTQVPLAIGLVVLALFDSPVTAFAYLALAGVTMGCMAPVVGSVYPELYGVVHLGSIRALTSSFMVVSTALAPFVMGWMIDEGVSMSALAGMSAGYIGVVMVPVIIVLSRRA